MTPTLNGDDEGPSLPISVSIGGVGWEEQDENSKRKKKRNVSRGRTSMSSHGDQRERGAKQFGYKKGVPEEADEGQVLLRFELSLNFQPFD